jgi:hypothetical protein
MFNKKEIITKVDYWTDWKLIWVNCVLIGCKLLFTPRGHYNISGSSQNRDLIQKNEKNQKNKKNKKCFFCFCCFFVVVFITI